MSAGDGLNEVTAFDIAGRAALMRARRREADAHLDSMVAKRVPDADVSPARRQGDMIGAIACG